MKSVLNATELCPQLMTVAQFRKYAWDKEIMKRLRCQHLEILSPAAAAVNNGNEHRTAEQAKL
jgi:hypothetical protein